MARVLIAVLDRKKPSSRLRWLAALDILRQRGHQVELLELSGGTRARFALLLKAAQADVVVLQKKLFSNAFVRLLTELNPRLIYDLDDAVMFHELERNEALTGRFFSRFCCVANRACAVIAGNAYVAEFALAARQGSAAGVYVLPTAPDDFPPKPAGGQRERIVIGWLGTRGNLDELRQLAPALRAACAQNPALLLRVISNDELVLDGVPVDCRRWSKETEAAEIQDFDIGIMPLADTLWNRGKGGFKLLQYMAAGVATVSSPVGINREIIRHGENGFSAATDAEWTAAILALAADASQRCVVGERAAQTIREQYARPIYLSRLADLIDQCANPTA